jgi:hypothetical protein
MATVRPVNADPGALDGELSKTSVHSDFRFDGTQVFNADRQAAN